MEYQPLKIIAEDEENLNIILTLLQDSIMPVVSIVFDRENKTATLLTNRFCWEIPEDNNENSFYRVHAGLLFHNVEAMHEKNIDQNNKKRILSFLVSQIEKKDDHYHVYLMFSDDACIRFTLSNIKCTLADVDEPWVSESLPTHLPKKKTAQSKNI